MNGKMIKSVLTILLSLFVFISVHSQTPQEAASYFDNEKYEMAFESYANLMNKNPKEALYIYRYAYSAYMLGENKLAAEYFEKSANKYPMAYYFMGKIYFDAYLFEKAADAYTDFLEESTLSDSIQNDIEIRIEQAELGDRLIRRVEDVEIVDSVVLNKNNFLEYFQLAKDLGKIKQVSQNYAGNLPEIEYITQRGDRKYISRIVNGKFQLFTSQKLLSSWDVEKSVDEINSMGEVNFPFLQADGLTFYFGAKGEGSLGGYDIFITRLNLSNNQFLKPENVGMPFNSPYNDYMMVMDDINQVGWFVTDRYMPDDKVAIYQFIPNKEKIVITSDNPMKSIKKAKLIDFIPNKEKSYSFQNKEENLVIARGKEIFINNTTRYADESSFVSQTARNYYFQSEKLIDELQMVNEELKEQRAKFQYSQNERESLSKTILSLENQKMNLLAQIEGLQHQMRQEENKILSY